MSGIRVFGAGWERVSATARVVFIIYVCEQVVMALKNGSIDRDERTIVQDEYPHLKERCERYEI